MGLQFLMVGTIAGFALGMYIATPEPKIVEVFPESYHKEYTASETLCKGIFGATYVAKIAETKKVVDLDDL
jgi:hypothetical protein